MSNWKVATISKISVDFDGSHTMHMVTLCLHGNDGDIVLPSMAWGPKPNHRFGEKTVGKFDIEQDEEAGQVDGNAMVKDAQDVMEVDWSTLREVRIVD